MVVRCLAPQLSARQMEHARLRRAVHHQRRGRTKEVAARHTWMLTSAVWCCVQYQGDACRRHQQLTAPAASERLEPKRDRTGKEARTCASRGFPSRAVYLGTPVPAIWRPGEASAAHTAGLHAAHAAGRIATSAPW